MPIIDDYMIRVTKSWVDVMLTPVNGKKNQHFFGTGSESVAYLKGIRASKVSLRSLSGDYFKLLISKHSPDFLFFTPLKAVLN